MIIRISIVEDDQQFRQMLEEYLGQAEGFSCVSAYGDPRVALRSLASDEPDVVLMDLQLPGMSGIDCVSALRQQAPAIRAIMLTVFEQDEQVFQSLAAGAYGYVLTLLARGDTYFHIAQRMGITVHTVRNYIRRIYDKLQVHSRTEAVAKFTGYGA